MAPRNSDATTPLPGIAFVRIHFVGGIFGLYFILSLQHVHFLNKVYTLVPGTRYILFVFDNFDFFFYYFP